MPGLPAPVDLRAVPCAPTTLRTYCGTVNWQFDVEALAGAASLTRKGGAYLVPLTVVNAKLPR